MKNARVNNFGVIGLFVSLLMTSSCKKELTPDPPINTQDAQSAIKKGSAGFAGNNMVLYWNDKTTLVLSGPMNQAARSRYFAIIEIAVHDALNSIKPKYQRYALVDRREKFASPDAAIASAAYWAIKGLGREGSFPIDTWLNESLEAIPDGESKELGKALGKLSAEAIIAKRANDGFTQVIASASLPVNGVNPGEYRSTLPYSNPALNLAQIKTTPNWGSVLQPYVVQSNSQFRPTGPHPIQSIDYVNDFNESKSKGGKVGSTRTEFEDNQAKFWSEIRMSNTWNNLARQIIVDKKMDAWKTARLFALMHAAIADATNSYFEAKYYFYSWRPETAIRQGENDDNPNTGGDPVWLPNIAALVNANPLLTATTPPVPEYPSSFAAVGGAATEILRFFFDSDQISVDLTSASLPGTTLHYTSLSDLVRDNSLSMIFTGWYFRKAALDGETQGKQIAGYIFQNAFQDSDENEKIY